MKLEGERCEAGEEDATRRDKSRCVSGLEEKVASTQVNCANKTMTKAQSWLPLKCVEDHALFHVTLSERSGCDSNNWTRLLISVFNCSCILCSRACRALSFMFRELERAEWICIRFQDTYCGFAGPDELRRSSSFEVRRTRASPSIFFVAATAPVNCFETLLFMVFACCSSKCR